VIVSSSNCDIIDGKLVAETWNEDITGADREDYPNRKFFDFLPEVRFF
jgi:hypothetical protein